MTEVENEAKVLEMMPEEKKPKSKKPLILAGLAALLIGGIFVKNKIDKSKEVDFDDIVDEELDADLFEEDKDVPEEETKEEK